MTEQKTDRILREFSLLSRLGKQHRIVQWVKKGYPEIVPVLNKIAAEDSEVQIRYLARKGLFHLKKNIQEKGTQDVSYEDFASLKQKIQAGSNKEFSGALEHAIRNFPEELRSFLHQSLNNFREPFLVASSLMSLGKVGNSQSLPLICSFLKHTDSRVRASCIEAIGNLGLKEGTPYLISALRDQDNRIRANAIRALRVQGRQSVFEVLKEMVDSKEDWMRSSACFAIGEYKSQEVLSLLLKLLSDHNEVVKKQAFKSLEKLADAGIEQAVLLKQKFGQQSSEEESLEDFLAMVTSPQKEKGLLFSEDSQVRLQEIHRIVRDQDQSAYKDLEERLVIEEDNYVKASLILALGQVGQESALPVIRTFLTDSIPRLRANAVEALTGFGKKEYLVNVLLLLDDSNNRARANAIIALKDMPYVNVLEPLHNMVCSKELLNRQSAFYAITEIGTLGAFKLLEDLARHSEEKNLKENIQEQILMAEQEFAELSYLKDKLADILDFSTKEEEFAEVEATVEEEKLAPSYTEVDFEGFRPDNLEVENVSEVRLDKYSKATAEEKVLLIEIMKENLTQDHYTILRLSEKDKDFQVKCMAKMALSSYKGKSFEDVDLEQYQHQFAGKQGSIEPAAQLMNDFQILRQTIEYGGEEPLNVLNRDLANRAEISKQQGVWEGRFGGFSVLNALRMDTQEMVSQVLEEEQFEIEEVGLCWFSPTYKPFLEGIKSLDGVNYENFIQLNTIKNTLMAQDMVDPISEIVRSCIAPKYMLVIVTSGYLTLFLRHALGYGRAEYVKIPRSRISAAKNLKLDDGSNHVEIVFGEGNSFQLPRLQYANAQRLCEILDKIK
jgi:HEAT repeat protein